MLYPIRATAVSRSMTRFMLLFIAMRRGFAGSAPTQRVFCPLSPSEVLTLPSRRGHPARWPRAMDESQLFQHACLIPMDPAFHFVGSAFCGNRGAAAWCMPLDGSAPAVKIADEGKVVGVL